MERRLSLQKRALDARDHLTLRWNFRLRENTSKEARKTNEISDQQRGGRRKKRQAKETGQFEPAAGVGCDLRDVEDLKTLRQKQRTKQLRRRIWSSTLRVERVEGPNLRYLTWVEVEPIVAEGVILSAERDGFDARELSPRCVTVAGSFAVLASTRV
ncbi:hypothetical protein BHM03_00021455 [Ensete ventricosum]|nr:hypothetical protein BHM03_00021455 [Ensete ventricosum]